MKTQSFNCALTQDLAEDVVHFSTPVIGPVFTSNDLVDQLS